MYVCVCKLLKKVWNVTFALIFCIYFFIIFTWVLHVLKGCLYPYILKKKTHENRSGESLPNAVGVKIKTCRNSIS